MTKNMKKILMVAVAIICMSVCVVSCSSDDEDNKRYGYGVWVYGPVANDPAFEYLSIDYLDAIRSQVGNTGKKDDDKVIKACDKVYEKHIADYGDLISGTVTVYRVEEGSEQSTTVKDYTYHGTN